MIVSLSLVKFTSRLFPNQDLVFLLFFFIVLIAPSPAPAPAPAPAPLPSPAGGGQGLEAIPPYCLPPCPVCWERGGAGSGSWQQTGGAER